MTYSLGRVHSPDPRDAAFPVSDLLKTLPVPKRAATSVYWWDDGAWLDQGQTPQCVAYAWSHWTADGPVINRLLEAPSALYHDAQVADEWPGENYDGTSVRGAAKVLKTKGLITSYFWATKLSDIVTTIMLKGPMVMGTNWSNSMFTPDSRGVVHYNRAQIVGGHAWVVNGYNKNTRLFRCKNSWGRSWGQQGHFYVSDVDMAKLLADQGEGCIAVEKKLA